MTRSMFCFLLVASSAALPAQATTIFSLLTDKLRMDLPLNMPTDTAVATLSIVPRNGATPIVWNIGDISTSGTVASRTRVLDATSAAGWGVDWALANLYLTNNGSGQLAPMIDLIQRVSVGELVAQYSILNWASNANYRHSFPPGSSLTNLQFELTAFATNETPPAVPWDPPTGLRSAYVGATYTYTVAVPEPASWLMLCFGLLHCVKRRSRSCRL